MTQQNGGPTDGGGYVGPGTGRSGLAVAAMVCGIVGVLTAIVLVGVAVGVVAIVLGSVALVQTSRRGGPQGRGMAVTGLVLGILAVVIGPVLLFAALLVPGLGRARELSNRSACAANVRGIAQSMCVYAADNGDIFPVAPYAPLGAGNAGTSTESTGAATADDAVHFVTGGKSAQNGNPLEAGWLLVLSGQVAPKGMMCRSDPFTAVPAAQQDATGHYYANFQNDGQISYSFAYPYARKADGSSEVGYWWKNTNDSSQPVLSDMAPLDGTGTPKRTLGAPIVMPSRAWNSGNHLGDGENVAFADAHAEFFRRPDIGAEDDNIFTVGEGGPSSTGRQPGKGPIVLGEKPPLDTVMVPVRNLDTGKLW